MNFAIEQSSKASQKYAWSTCNEIMLISEGEMLTFSFINFTLEKCRHFRYQLRERESLWFKLWNLMFSFLHCFYHFRYLNKEWLCCSFGTENGPELSCDSFSWQLRRRKYQLFSHWKCPKPRFKAVSRGCKSALLCIKLPKYARPQGFRILQFSLSVKADKPALSQFSAIRLAVELSSR